MRRATEYGLENSRQRDHRAEGLGWLGLFRELMALAIVEGTSSQWHLAFSAWWPSSALVS